MKIELTQEKLTELDACEEAIKGLTAVLGPSPWSVDWTPEKQIELLKTPIGKNIGWGFARKLIPMWSMSGADLSGADLSRANLSGAYLSGAYLSGAYLSGAYLSGANLSRANLSGADLSGADLSGADLSRAYLSRVNLSGWVVGEDGLAKRADQPAKGLS